MSALERSVVKWEEKLSWVQNNLGKPFRNVHYLFGTTECPLCKLYNHKDCIGCPIYKKTGLEYCSMGTPYDELENYFAHMDYELDEKLISIIKKEIRFLKSLLPKQNKAKIG